MFGRLKSRLGKFLWRIYKPQTIGGGAISAVLVTLAIYFGSQIIGGALLSLYGVMQGWPTEQTMSWVASSTAAQFVFIVVVEALTLYFLYLFVKRRKITLAGLGLSKPDLKKLSYAIPAYFAYFFLLLFVFGLMRAFVSGINFDQPQQVGFQSAHGMLLILAFVSLVLLPAFVEEVLVRGFLYGGLRSKFTKLNAALITSVIFAVAHLQIGSGEAPLWTAAIDTFILSMVLVGLREKTGNIWAGIIVHFIKNSLAFFALFVFTGGV